MSILLIESFEIAAEGKLDLTTGPDHQYVKPETLAAFWAWTEARKNVVVSLPDPSEPHGEQSGSDLFTRDQIAEMAGAAGVIID